MKKYIKIKNLFSIALMQIILLVSGCDMDIPNPNAATVEEAYSTQSGILAVSVGMRRFYSTTAYDNIIITPGVTSRELGAFTTFVNYLNLEEGGEAVQDDNSWPSGLWANLYRVISISEQIVDSAPDVIDDPGTLAGVIAHANFFKAASLGYIIQAFEQAPITTNEAGEAVFMNRAEVLAESIRLLEEAKAAITANPPPQSFIDATGPDFDWPNMINTYLSRYYLLAGNYQDAIAAADAVDLSSVSYFVYSTEVVNPIWDLLINGNDFRPLDNFGIDPAMIDPADQRQTFFLAPLDTVSAQLKLPVDDMVTPFFNNQTASIPVYVPGEVLLNKAEALARSGDINEAITVLNEVRTKTTDAVGLGAAISPYAGPVTAEAVLDDIYTNRNLELFLTGMRLEDSRRFDKPGPNDPNLTRNRNFYYYPDTEKANNPNVPADPPI